MALFLMPLGADAKTLYVNSVTGNDAVTYANNGLATPWRTIGRAAWGSADRSLPGWTQAAVAGDIIRIASGTYTTVGSLTGGGGGREAVAYNPINSGTLGNPIRFECEGVCVLTYSAGAGPMIGATQRNYIEWSGFSINELTAPSRQDTGPVTFFRVTGGSIENSTLVGNPTWTSRQGDNYNGVRLEDALGVRIFNNRISDFGGQTTGPDRNHSGITTYRSYPLIIENNEIVNCGSGIYLKGTSTTSVVQAVIVRYNIIRNVRFGIDVLQQPMTAAQPLLIYQNLLLDNREGGLWINMFDNTNTDAKWVRFFNNTLVNNVSGIATYNNNVFPPAANFLFWNNIVAGTGNRLRQDTSNAVTNNQKDRHDYDRNLYASSQFEFGGEARTLSYVQGLGQDTNTVIANPAFVGPTDYRLTAGSPARTVGRAVHGLGGANGTIIPAGAYITGNEIIGPTNAMSLPRAPTGLRITPGP